MASVGIGGFGGICEECGSNGICWDKEFWGCCGDWGPGHLREMGVYSYLWGYGVSRDSAENGGYRGICGYMGIGNLGLLWRIEFRDICGQEVLGHLRNRGFGDIGGVYEYGVSAGNLIWEICEE